MNVGITFHKVAEGLAAFLIVSLLIATPITSYAEPRHSPELHGRSAEIQEAPEALISWVSSLGREDLGISLREALDTNNQTLVRSALKSIQNLIFSDSPTSLFVGVKHLTALKLLNWSDDLSVSTKDFSRLLYYVTLHLNKTDYTALSKALLTVLSGVVSYGDHSKLSYFMLYLARDEVIPNVSEGLRSSLRLQILKFLDYIESGELKKAVEVGVNTSYSNSLIIGSYMYVVASIYSKYTPPANPTSGLQDSSKGVEVASRVLEIIERMNLTTTLAEILKRIPAEDLWAALNKLNILNTLDVLDEEVLVGEISKYLMEQRLETPPEAGLPLRPWGSGTTVVKVETTAGGQGSSPSYRLTNELNTLMNLAAAKAALEVRQKSSGTSETLQSSILSDSPAGLYGPAFITILSFMLVLSMVLFAVKLGKAFRMPAPTIGTTEPLHVEAVINSTVVKIFWRVINELANRLDVRVEKHETHREIKTKIIEKAIQVVSRELPELLNLLTQYYELVRFGNVCEDEVMRSEARRVEESILKE